MLPRVMVEAVDSAPSNDYGSEEGPEATEYTVTLTCIVITLMLLVKLVERRLPVNSNVFLFLAGFALAAVTTAAGVGTAASDTNDDAEAGGSHSKNSHYCNHSEEEGSSHGGHWKVGVCALDAVKTVDASVFVLVLLPPLIYEASSSVDFHVFKRTFNSIFWLAAPGVALSAVLHAWAFDPFGIDTGWTFSQSLTLGSILAATDPVSVVAALHDLHAPPELTTIIDGESLLNDGTAMVLFMIFKAIAFEGASYTVWSGITLGAQLAVGGVALGVVSFWALHEWLAWATHEWLESTLAVLLVFYAVFFASEALLGVSGILAVVTMGLGMGWYGKYAIWPSAVEKLEVVTSTIAALAEALIFFFSGIVSLDALAQIDVLRRPVYLGRLALLFVVLQVVRTIVVLLGVPVYNWTKSNSSNSSTSHAATYSATGERFYSMRPKELAIVSFSGLRGAVGLALAMTLKQGQDSMDRDGSSGSDKLGPSVQDEVFFYVAGSVVLTLLINGTLMVPLYHYLDIYPELNEKQSDREAALRSLLKSVEADVDTEIDRRRHHDWLFQEVLGVDGDGGATLNAIKKLVPSFAHVAFTHASLIMLQASPGVLNYENDDDVDKDDDLGAKKVNGSVVRSSYLKLLKCWKTIWRQSSTNYGSGTNGAEGTVKSVLDYLLPIAHCQEHLRASRQNATEPFAPTSPVAFASTPDPDDGHVRVATQLNESTVAQSEEEEKQQEESSNSSMDNSRGSRLNFVGKRSQPKGGSHMVTLPERSESNLETVPDWRSVDRDAYDARFLGHDRIFENRAKRRTSKQKNGSSSTCDSNSGDTGTGTSTGNGSREAVSTATSTALGSSAPVSRRKHPSGSSSNSSSGAEVINGAASSASSACQKRASSNHHSSPAATATAVSGATEIQQRSIGNSADSNNGSNANSTEIKRKSWSDNNRTSNSGSKFPKNPNPATSASTTSVALPTQESETTNTATAVKLKKTKTGNVGEGGGNRGGKIAVAAKEKLLTARSAGNSVAFQDDSMHSRRSNSGAPPSFKNSPQKSTSIGEWHNNSAYKGSRGAQHGGATGGFSGSAHALARGWHLVGYHNGGNHSGHSTSSSSSASRRRRKSRARPHAAADGTLYAAATQSSIFTLQRQDATVLSRYNTPGVTRQNSRKGSTPTAKHGKIMWNDEDAEEKRFMESTGSNVSSVFGARSTSKPSSRSKAPVGIWTEDTAGKNAAVSAGDGSSGEDVVGNGVDGAGTTAAQSPASDEMDKVLQELDMVLDEARFDHTYCSMVFTALSRLYKMQFQEHKLTESALVCLDAARHAGIAFMENKMLLMAHTHAQAHWKVHRAYYLAARAAEAAAADNRFGRSLRQQSFRSLTQTPFRSVSFWGSSFRGSSTRSQPTAVSAAVAVVTAAASHSNNGPASREAECGPPLPSSEPGGAGTAEGSPHTNGGDNDENNALSPIEDLSLSLAEEVGADSLLERSLFVEFEALVKSLPDPLTFVKWWPRALVVPAYVWFPPLRVALRFFAFQKVFTAVESLVGFIRAHEDLVDFLAHMEAQTHQETSTSTPGQHPSFACEQSPNDLQTPSSSSLSPSLPPPPPMQSSNTPQHTPVKASSFREESVHVRLEATATSPQSSNHNITKINANSTSSYKDQHNDVSTAPSTAAASTAASATANPDRADFKTHDNDADVHADQVDFNANLSAIDTTIKDRLQEASRAIVELAKAKLSALETEFPETVCVVKAMLCAMETCRMKMRLITQLHARGVLGEADTETLLAPLQRCLEGLHLAKKRVALGAAADKSLRHHWNLRPSTTAAPPTSRKLDS